MAAEHADWILRRSDKRDDEVGQLQLFADLIAKLCLVLDDQYTH